MDFVALGRSRHLLVAPERWFRSHDELARGVPCAADQRIRGTRTHYQALCALIFQNWGDGMSHDAKDDLHDADGTGGTRVMQRRAFAGRRARVSMRESRLGGWSIGASSTANGAAGGMFTIKQISTPSARISSARRPARLQTLGIPFSRRLAASLPRRVEGRPVRTQGLGEHTAVKRAALSRSSRPKA